MNIFYIPSWYPSEDEPLAGIFHQEQAVALANAYPDLQLGISLWGQKTEANLLWAKDHVKNLAKIIHFPTVAESTNQLRNNLWEYHSPSLTWTDRFLKGNIRNIIRANEKNLHRFEARVGKADLIHAQVSFPAGYIAMCLAKSRQLPYLITEQMSPFPFECYMKGDRIMHKVLKPLQQANAVAALTPHAANDIRQKTGIQPLVIPNLVDETLFSPSSGAEFQDVNRPFTFFTLGRMVPQKGIPDLIRAISLLPNQRVRFRIGGAGEELATYQQMADAAGVSSRINWLGELSRIQAAEEFRNCHAFVLPSLHESMGVVFAEAIACGKPFISTRNGGAEFIITPENGFLVDVGAPVQLANAMMKMIDNYKQFSSARIREDFMRRFSTIAITRQIFSLYKSLIL